MADKYVGMLDRARVPYHNPRRDRRRMHVCAQLRAGHTAEYAIHHRYEYQDNAGLPRRRVLLSMPRSAARGQRWTNSP